MLAIKQEKQFSNDRYYCIPTILIVLAEQEMLIRKFFKTLNQAASKILREALAQPRLLNQSNSWKIRPLCLSP